MKDLMSLEEYNRKQNQRYIQPEYPRPNGIACPKCGEELADMDDLVLCSMPPKKNVICQKCGYRGYATA